MLALLLVAAVTVGSEEGRGYESLGGSAVQDENCIRPSSEPAAPLYVPLAPLLAEPEPWQEWGVRDWEHEA